MVDRELGIRGSHIWLALAESVSIMIGEPVPASRRSVDT